MPTGWFTDMDALGASCPLRQFERNTRFVGRDDEISRLRANIFKQGRSRKIAIAGLGGVGKTQVAIELAYRVREEYPDCSIFWIPCMSSGTIEQAYVAASEKLGLPHLPGKDVKLQLKSHLSQQSSGPWLLIYDNADDMEMWIGNDNPTGALKAYLPQCPQGFVLFTTRNRQLAVKLAAPDVVELPHMNEETALHMLRTSLINAWPLRDNYAVDTLLYQLTCLPLAITQAAAYINENGIGISDYLELLKEQEEDVIDLLSEDFEDGWRYSEIKNPVATTWLISFNQVRQLDKLAARYLAFMACIHAKDIPLSLLPGAPSSKKRTDALGLLSAYSFININRETQLLNLHRLVHLATRNWLRKAGTFDDHVNKTLTRISEVFPVDKHENRPLWRAYMPHAQLMLKQKGFDEIIAKERKELLKKVGLCLDSDGRYNEAEPLLVELLDKLKERLEPDTLEVCDYTGLVALTYRHQGRWKEAESLQLQVLEKTIKACGHEHLKTATAMANLALTYSDLGRWKEADKLVRQILPIRQKQLGSDHPDTAATLAHLASIYWDLGQRKEAEELEEQVLEMRRRVLGPEHPDTLDIMDDRASSHSIQGRWKEAETLQIHLVEIQKRVLGTKHPATLTTMTSLASTFGEQQRWEESEELTIQVLGERKAVLGLEHPETLSTTSHLALTYRGQGQFGKAEEMQIYLLDANTKLLGPSHPTTLTSMIALATTYIYQGKLDQAEILQKEALEIQTRDLGEEHPATLTTMTNLAVTYGEGQQWEAAEKLLTQVLQLSRRVLGPENPQTLVTMHNLITTYIGQSKWQMAEGLAMQLLEIQQRCLGQEHPHTLKTVANMISIARGKELWDEVDRLEILLFESKTENLALGSTSEESEE